MSKLGPTGKAWLMGVLSYIGFSATLAILSSIVGIQSNINFIAVILALVFGIIVYRKESAQAKETKINPEKHSET